MTNNETYCRAPEKRLDRVLDAAGWESVGPGLWQKDQKRIAVDAVGIFLFKLDGDHWTRTHGLTHNLISKRHLDGRYLLFPGQKFNL